MPYYHVYVAYEDKKGARIPLFGFNLPEEIVRQHIVNPYMKNEDFMFVRRAVPRPKILEIEIFKSEKHSSELILPNGKSPLETKDNDYIVSCFSLGEVKGVRICTFDFIPSLPKATIDLMGVASFLGLDTNWSQATCALQLQEVAVTLVAEKKKIKLDKTNVERILNKKIEGELSFNDRYRAFSRQVKASFKIEMPRLTTHLRKMRTEVLHQGYNPTPEETEPITNFTIGLLKKLDACIEKQLPYLEVGH